MAEWTIYGIYEGRTLLYVGRTENPRERWHAHQCADYSGPQFALAANYSQFGFADDGEADKVADRLLAVLDQLGCEIVRKS